MAATLLASKKLFCIYKITNNIDDLIYIGSTSQTLTERFNEHISSAKMNFNLKLYNHMNKLGLEHFTIELISEHYCISPLNFEQMEMNKYPSCILLNSRSAHAKSKLSEYEKERRGILKLIYDRIFEHNENEREKWDPSLIDPNLCIGILNDIFNHVYDGTFLEIFKNGKLNLKFDPMHLIKT